MGADVGSEFPRKLSVAPDQERTHISPKHRVRIRQLHQALNTRPRLARRQDRELMQTVT